MKEKILIVALGLAVIYLIRNELLDKVKSEEKWEKQKMKNGFASVKKMEKQESEDDAEETEGSDGKASDTAEAEKIVRTADRLMKIGKKE